MLIEHQALAAHMLNLSAYYAVTPQDRVLQFSTFSFDAAQEQIFTALCNGAGLVLRGNALWSSAEFEHQVSTHRISIADLPTAYFQQMLTLWLQDRPAFLDKPLRLIPLTGRSRSTAHRPALAAVGRTVNTPSQYLRPNRNHHRRHRL